MIPSLTKEDFDLLADIQEEAGTTMTAGTMTAGWGGRRGKATDGYVAIDAPHRLAGDQTRGRKRLPDPLSRAFWPAFVCLWRTLSAADSARQSGDSGRISRNGEFPSKPSICQRWSLSLVRPRPVPHLPIFSVLGEPIMAALPADPCAPCSRPSIAQSRRAGA